MNVFVHTDILLDVLGEQGPFYADSARVWTLAETGQIAGFISTLSLPTLCYKLRRAKGRSAARKTMGTLRDIFSLVPLDQQITNQAVDADIEDFEDAIQFFSALRCEAAALVTRNPKDYPTGDVAIQTPAEFLATHFPG